MTQGRRGAVLGSLDWPLVGREEVLERITAELEGPGALLVGAPGVGKSRLAREVRTQAASHGLATEWLAATSSAATIPFGALAGVLPRQHRSTGSVELLQAASAALVSGAAGRPLLVCVDDIHLLDAASATVVHDLVATRRARVLGTARSLAECPDAVLALWKDEGVQRIAVSPLGPAAVIQLAEHMLGGPTSTVTRHRLWAMSEGNPLLLRELLADAMSGASLRGDGDGGWHWYGPATPGPRLVDLITARLGRLSHGDRDLLELLALGEPLPPAALQKLCPDGSSEQLERRGLLATTRVGRRLEAHLPHPLYAEVLRSALPVGRRLVLHRRLALTVQEYGTHRHDDTMRLAYWLLESDIEGDPTLFVEAAREALRHFDMVLGERLGRAAMPGAGPVAELIVGIALDGQRRYDEAVRVLSSVLSTRAGEVAGQAASTLAHALAYGLGRPDDARDVLISTGTTLSDPFWRSSLQAELADLLISVGELSEPGRIACALLSNPQVDEQVRLQAVWPAQGSLSMSGRQDDAVAIGRDVVPGPFRRTRLSGLASRALVSHGLALMYAGQLGEADEIAAAGLTEATASGNWRTHGMWANLLGWIAIRQGRPTTARRSLLEATILMRERDPDELLGLTLTLLCQANAMSGNVASGGKAAREAQAWLARRPRPFDEAMVGALAWLPAAEGELSRARRQLLTAAEAAADRGGRGISVHLLHDAMRLGGGRDIAQRLQSAAVDQQGTWAPAFARHAAAVLGGEGDAFAAASADFATFGAVLHAAETAAQAGAAYARVGRTASALAAAARCRRLLADCEDARSPLPILAGEPADLTAREREIAGLAARGLSNAAISASLVVSIRTVEGHLYQAFGKLGITHRRELVDVLDLPIQNR